MRTKPILTFIVTALLFSATVKAQSCDPWITQAYKQLYGRTPSTAECNIRNYNSGSWSSYAELVGYIAGHNRYKSGNFLKGDPWIFQAYVELYNRIPNAWEVNIQNYNNGSWGSYAELKNYIKQYQNAMSKNGIKTNVGKLNNNTAVVFTDNNNNVLAVDLVKLDGGQVISAGGGNVISAGGGNVISVGGGNLTINQSTPGVSFGGDRTIQSTGTKVVATAGKTKLVIR
ncbi:MAG TPA: hypothetical protein VGN63_06375 [Flavisolibacter sp.]|jgi:hypothetical protein|nr:hypothetical protein [Flavisolibacter sp.]